MKAITIISLLGSLTLASSLSAQTLAPAYVFDRDGEIETVFVEAASEKTVRYRRSERSTNRIDTRLNSITIKFLKPKEFAIAEALYENGRFEDALAEFTKTREKYEFSEDVPGNYSTLAGFYEMECARKLGNYTKLAELRRQFQPEPLLLESDKEKYRIGECYEAVEAKSWSRLTNLAKGWVDKKLSPPLRAEVSYLLGLGYKGEEKYEDALVELNRAIVSNAGSDLVQTKNAVIACFEIFETYPIVVEARRVHGTPAEEPNSPGNALLGEAAALVTVWEQAHTNGEKLPSKYREYLKYATAEPEPAAEEKKDEKK